MNKKFLLIFLLPITLFAQETDDALFKVQNDPPPFSPFAVSGSYINIASASFRTPHLSGQHLKYRQWEAGLSYKHPFSCDWGLLFGSGWVGAEIDMTENPEFDEKIFTYVNGLIGAYTTAFPDWLWKFTLSTFIDMEEFSFVDYALYQGVIWGKYDLCKCVELDFGFITEFGLSKNKVWPIIGFMYVPTPKWSFNFVYPIDVSINYTYAKCLVASLSARFLRNRHRVKDTEPNPQAIFEYRTTGVELDLNYTPFVRLILKGFVGSTGKGDFKVSDRKDHHSIHYKFNGAFYAGASAILSY